MGGNVIFNGIGSDRIEIQNQYSRDRILDRLTHLFAGINRDLKLWATDKHTIEEYLAGSTVFLFDTRIPVEALIEVKPTFGDVDIQFDKNRVDAVVAWLTNIPEIGMFRLVGWLKSIDTVVTLWQDQVTKKNYQVDLEMVEFENGIPSAWSKFSRSSDWDDLELGIKGFAHKYIFRAITAKDLIDTNVQLKTKLVRKKITPVVFSPKGARKKYHSVGINVWEEIPMDESLLIRDVEDLFELFFDGQARGDEVDLMYSYRGVIELILRYIDKNDFGAIADGMANLLWGKGAQEVVRDDKDSDFAVKASAYDYLVTRLGVNSTAMGHPLATEYYKTF